MLPLLHVRTAAADAGKLIRVEHCAQGMLPIEVLKRLQLNEFIAFSYHWFIVRINLEVLYFCSCICFMHNSQGMSPSDLVSDTDILQCTDHMCPLRVHWHIKNNFLDHWRVKLTISNYNLGRNYSNWNVLVQHPGFSQNSTSYSFNSIVLPTIGVPGTCKYCKNIYHILERDRVITSYKIIEEIPPPFGFYPSGHESVSSSHLWKFCR